MMISTIWVNATPEQIFALLTDYERYIDWTPDVVIAKVLAQEGDIVVAEFRSPELMAEAYQLEFVHSKPASIVYKQKGIYEQTGRYEYGLSGGWLIDARADRHGVMVTASMRLRTRYLKHVSNQKKVRLVLQRRLDVIRQMYETSSAAITTLLPESGDLALRRALGAMDTQTVWVHGNKYQITKINAL